MNNIIEKIVSDVSLDERIQDGIFTLENNDHMDILREYLANKGIDEVSVVEFCNRVLEGKYPERQAYNEKGILVTFPTPEYKQRAIKRGTHFEKDPTKASPNVFGGTEEQPTAQQAPSGPEKQPSQPGGPSPQQQEKGSEDQPPKTNLPLSKSAGAPVSTEPGKEPTPQSDETPSTSVAPEPATTTTAPTAAVDAEAEDGEGLPPPMPKSKPEKESEKDIIKKMIATNDFKLEQLHEWLKNNGTDFLKEWMEDTTPN